LYVLNQDAVGTCRIDEADLGATRSGLRGLVDQQETAAARVPKRGCHVVDLQGNVVDALAAVGEELGDFRLVTDWLEQLDRHRARTEKGDPYIRKAFFAAKVQAKRSLEVRARLVYRPYRPPQMVNRRHYAAASGLDLLRTGVMCE